MTLKELLPVLDINGITFWNQLKHNITGNVQENISQYLGRKVLNISYGSVTLLTPITESYVLSEYDVDGIISVNPTEQMLDPTIIDIHIKQVAYVTYCDLANV